MPSEHSEQNLQRDTDKHDQGLAVVTRRNLRAPAATPQRLVSCRVRPDLRETKVLSCPLIHFTPLPRPCIPE